MVKQLIIDGVRADLSSRVNVPVNFVVDDIKNIGKTSSPFSLTVTLPFTNTNAYIFEYLNNPSVTQRFVSAKKKLKVEYYEDGLQIFQGYAQIKKASQKGFEIQLFSDLTNFGQTIKDKMLHEIDPALTSYLTHQLTPSKFLEFQNQSDNRLTYPAADYGKYNTLLNTQFYLDDLRPALWAKDYFRFIIKSAGYIYNEEYCDALFDNIIITNGSENQIEFTQGAAGAQIPTALNYKYTQYVTPVYGYTDVTENTLGWLSGSTLTAGFATRLNIDVAFPGFNLNWESDTPNLTLNSPTVFVGVVIRKNGSLVKTTTLGQYNISAKYLPNDGTGKGRLIQSFDKIELNNIVVDVAAGDTVSVGYYVTALMPEASFFKRFLVNTKVSGRVYFVSSVYQKPTVRFKIQSGIENATLSYSDMVQKDIRQTDMFSSLMNTFRLFPVFDKNNRKKITFIQSDEFYSSDTTVLDWSEKIDVSQDISVTPVPNLSTSKIVYSFKEDTDYFNALYKTLSDGETYGQLQLNTGYEFSDEPKQALDVIFAPTPVVQYEPSTPYGEAPGIASDINGFFFSSSSADADSKGTYTGMVIGTKIIMKGVVYTVSLVTDNKNAFIVTPLPTGISAGEAVYFQYAPLNGVPDEKVLTVPVIVQSDDNNFTRKPVKHAPRLLYLKTLSNDNLPNKIATFNFASSQSAPSTITTGAHLLNGKDLNFGRPNGKVFFVPDETYPNYYDPINDKFNNDFESLFKYHRNQYLEVVSNDAKLISGFFNLNALDIAKLRLSESIFIKGIRYRVNQIVNWMSDRLTRVELIKVVRRYHENIIPIYVENNTASGRATSITSVSEGDGGTFPVTYGNSTVRTTKDKTARDITIGLSGATLSNPALIAINGIDQTYQTGTTKVYEDIEFKSEGVRIELKTPRTNLRVTNDATANNITAVNNVPGAVGSYATNASTNTLYEREMTAGTASIAVVVSGTGARSLDLYVDSSKVACLAVSGAGTYTFPSRAYAAGNVIQIVLNNTDTCTPPPANGNVYIENNHTNPAYTITSISNIPGFSPAGGYPINISSGRSGTHNTDITGSIVVNLGGSVPTGKGRLYIWDESINNWDLLFTVNVSGDKLTFALFLTTLYQTDTFKITYDVT